jgi:hypothetical protein
VLTADYDVGIAGEDIAAFNERPERSGLIPTRTPIDARRLGRCALETTSTSTFSRRVQ